MEPKEKLIIALDVDSFEKAEGIVELLDRDIDVFKVGIAPFTSFGQRILDLLNKKGKKIFLDLKFHDIPNTVSNAAKAACDKNVFMMNFHCAGGSVMLKAAVEAVSGVPTEKRPVLLGVTVLTSMAQKDLEEIGMKGYPEEKVLEFARMAREAGMNGVVASAREARKIKDTIGEEFLIVTPGVRPEWAARGDQKRVLTPCAAIEAGADYLVVGRPVIQAEDPRAAARKIIEEISSK